MSILKFLAKAALYFIGLIVLVGLMMDSGDGTSSSSSNLSTNGKQSVLHKMVHGDLVDKSSFTKGFKRPIDISLEDYAGKEVKVDLKYSVGEGNSITIKGNTNLPPYTLYSIYVRRDKGTKASATQLKINEDGSFSHTFKFDITKVDKKFNQPFGKEMNIQFFTMTWWQLNHRDDKRLGAQIENAMMNMKGFREGFINGVSLGDEFEKVIPFDETKLIH